MIEEFIKPEEVGELWKHQIATEYAYSRQIFLAALNSDMSDNLREYRGIFHAGIIAGIRMERAKRRRKK